MPDFSAKYLRSRAISRPVIGLDHTCFDRAVVIPALAESVHLPSTLDSLACNPEPLLARTLVLIVVNHRCGAAPEIVADNLRTLAWLKSGTVLNAACETQNHKIHLGWIDAASPGHELPDWAGVGLARKIGCDSVIALGVQPACVLFNLDADTLVEPDYLAAAEPLLHSGKAAGNLQFRHQAAATPENQWAIDRYEAFLHDYVAGLRRAGSPYAFHAMGSAFCMTAAAYVRAGGFHAQRQAGEDFYLLQQLAKTGGIAELAGTTVHPSPRSSWRVPFGTGRRMGEAENGDESGFASYAPEVYDALAELLRTAHANLDQPVDAFLAAFADPLTRDFLDSRGIRTVWPKLQKQFSTPAARQRAFHEWFDALATLKFIHFLSEQRHPRLGQEKKGTPPPPSVIDGSRPA